MALVVEKVLRITEDNAETYCSNDTLSLGGNYAFELYFDDHTSGWAILEDAGKSILFPTSTARPFRIDSKISASRSAGKTYVILELDNISAHEFKVESITQKQNDLDNITKLNLPQDDNNDNDIYLLDYFDLNKKIAWQLDTSSTVNSCRVDWVELKLYFNQYDVYGYKANRAKGVKEIHVSTNHPYHGDTVTVTVDLEEGALWYGWYADPEHTILVSTDKDMVFTSGGDVVAYAYASLPTGINIKKNSLWQPTMEILQKRNGQWIYIEKEDIDLDNGRYKTLLL